MVGGGGRKNIGGYGVGTSVHGELLLGSKGAHCRGHATPLLPPLPHPATGAGGCDEGRFEPERCECRVRLGGLGGTAGHWPGHHRHGRHGERPPPTPGGDGRGRADERETDGVCTHQA